MKKLLITLFIVILYIIFICRPLALIHPIYRMWIFLILLVVQSMNTAIHFTLPHEGKKIFKVLTNILNILILVFGMCFAFMIFLVF